MDPVLIGVVAVLAIVVIYAIATYNRLVSLRNHLRDSWSGIDVELQRRYDLIPNLVEVCQGYAEHEREVFQAVTEARTRAQANTGTAIDQARDETVLMAGLERLLAVAEAYPELKANTQFQQLSEELSDTEDRIAATRRFYNGNVRELNTLIETFPSTIVANLFGFKTSTFFDLPDKAAREAPKVQLTKN